LGHFTREELRCVLHLISAAADRDHKAFCQVATKTWAVFEQLQHPTQHHQVLGIMWGKNNQVVSIQRDPVSDLPQAEGAHQLTAIRFVKKVV
jgi:hypothetical protein